MKAVYAVKAGESRVITFEQKCDAYQAKSELQSDSEDRGYIHVDKQIVCECYGEWANRFSD